MFMAIHLGGLFDSDFDYFKSTKANEFNHSNVIDIYDKYDENYEINFKKRPSIQIDYGTDWKQSLLDKAAKLDLYKKLILHDNNKTPLPFPDNYFKTIYSNSIYWIKEPRKLLEDIYRITSPGGLVSLEVLTPSRYELLDKLEEFLSPSAIDILDRNRRQTTQGMKTYSEWKEMMETAGFTIKNVSSVYPHKLIVDFWNIGLRPISHLLIQMSDNISIEKRMQIKQEWVSIFLELFKPLLQLNQSYSVENAPYLSFTLEK